MKKILLVANAAKEHVLKFHVPTIQMLNKNGWVVDVACGGVENIPFCHQKFTLPIDRSPYKTKFAKSIRQLRQIIKEEQYDIVYCHTTVGGLVGQLAAIQSRRAGSKVVKFSHGTYFYKGTNILNWLYYPLYKALSWVTDVFITITKEDDDFTRRHFSHAKTYYVPGIGIDPTRFQIESKHIIREKYRLELNIPQESTVLIYVAELIKNKNQKFLMDALRLVMKDNPNTYLLLVGPDHTDGGYESYAKEIGIWEHVRFLGWRKDIAELYSSADICVATSTREGLGLNIIEAMICDLPVIATNNSGHRAVIEDRKNGILVPLGDTVELAKQIEFLANSIDVRMKLVKASKLEVSKYYNENVLQRILEVLEEQVKL